MTQVYRSLNSRGDTIVEVLISIAVVSAVLGGAYMTMNRFSQNSQQTREHSQALKVAESQLEQLRVLSNPPTDDSKQFCITDGAVRIVENTSIGNTTPSTNESDYVNCKFDDRYLVSISRVAGVYKVHVLWQGVTGGMDKVELSYRVYPEAP